MTDRHFRIEGRRVWVAGHRGMVGSAIVRRLRNENCELLAVGRESVDLRRQAEVEDWMAAEKPEAVFMAAAKVGGILANDSQPADFLYDNLMIETNIIHAAHRTGVAKLLLLGSSCIYPKMAPQPMPEDALLTGPLEPTNQWYSVAKIAGIKLCQAYRRQHGCDFISAMPTNVYGAGDNFDLQTSHAAAALLVKTHQAKQAGDESVEIWGSGTPRREFLFVDDLADGLVFLMNRYSQEDHINIGSGSDLTIRDLAGIIAEVVGYQGDYTYDSSKPDGTPRKLMDSAHLNRLGWTARTDLRDGMRRTYDWYLANAA